MTEEYDALLQFNLLGSVGLVVGLLVSGVILELILRRTQRWTESKGRRLATVILGAMHWLPLIWCMLLSAAILLAGLSDVSIERQRGLEILWALLLISLTIVGVRILTGWVRILTEQRPSASVSVLRYLINGVAIIIVVTVVMYTLNVPTPLLLLTILGSTLGLSLALREPLSNLFSGVLLTASQRLSPGDFVRLPSGEEGRVSDIGWDVTSIHQERESEIIVPNSLLTKAEIINFDHPSSEYEIAIAVGVSYDSDLDVVERVTLQVADSVLVEMGDGPLPASSYLRYKEFAESDIKFKVYLRCEDFADRNRVGHEFIKQLHKRYKVEGIEMPYPILELHKSNIETSGVSSPGRKSDSSLPGVGPHPDTERVEED
jgi:small-conductance mechanosensitive channel